MTKCQQPAIVRYTWPGRDEMFACFEHASQLRGVAEAMSFHLQLIFLTRDEQSVASCSQNLAPGDDLEDSGG